MMFHHEEAMEKKALSTSQWNGSRDQPECRIENGRLFHERHWYHCNQPVYFEKDGIKMNGTIISINEREIQIRKSIDGIKLRILPSQLNRGKCNIKRRIIAS